MSAAAPEPRPSRSFSARNLPRLEEAVRRARLTVVPAARSRAPRLPFVMLVSAVLLAGVVGLLLFNTSMQQASFTTTALEDQADDLTAQRQNLETTLERLRDPQRVAERAQAMGLVIPASAGVLHLGTGKVDGAPVPATEDGRLQLTPPPPALPPGTSQPSDTGSGGAGGAGGAGDTQGGPQGHQGGNAGGHQGGQNGGQQGGQNGGHQGGQNGGHQGGQNGGQNGGHQGGTATLGGPRR